MTVAQIIAIAKAPVTREQIKLDAIKRKAKQYAKANPQPKAMFLLG